MCLRRAPEKYIAGAALDRAALLLAIISPHAIARFFVREMSRSVLTQERFMRRPLEWVEKQIFHFLSGNNWFPDFTIPWAVFQKRVPHSDLSVHNDGLRVGEWKARKWGGGGSGREQNTECQRSLVFGPQWPGNATAGGLRDSANFFPASESW
jgi:hypothetical protein